MPVAWTLPWTQPFGCNISKRSIWTCWRHFRWVLMFVSIVFLNSLSPAQITKQIHLESARANQSWWQYHVHCGAWHQSNQACQWLRGRFVERAKIEFSCWPLSFTGGCGQSECFLWAKSVEVSRQNYGYRRWCYHCQGIQKDIFEQRLGKFAAHIWNVALLTYSSSKMVLWLQASTRSLLFPSESYPLLDQQRRGDKRGVFTIISVHSPWTILVIIPKTC